MKINVTVNIDPEKILASRGLGSSREAVMFLGSEVKRLSDPYVPFQQGVLKNTASVRPAGKGAQLRYDTPYAHYQWEGKVMGPNYQRRDGEWRSAAPKGGKRYTGKALTYHGGLRGPRWTERMMADRKGDLVRSFAAYVGGRPG